MQIFGITALATILGTVIAVAIVHALRRRYGKLPQLHVAFTDTTSRSRRGSRPETLTCTWDGRLGIRNDSPSDALAFGVELINAPHCQFEQAPGTLRAGEQIELAVACSLDFDKREIHPSTYALPGTEPMPRDIDPLRERYPEELRHLTVRITCTNVHDRTGSQAFKRVDAKQMILQKSSRRKGGTA